MRKAIRKGAYVKFYSECSGRVIERKVIKKSGDHVIVYAPMKYLGGEIHDDRMGIKISEIIEFR